MLPELFYQSVIIMLVHKGVLTQFRENLSSLSRISNCPVYSYFSILLYVESIPSSTVIMNQFDSKVNANFILETMKF